MTEEKDKKIAELSGENSELRQMLKQKNRLLELNLLFQKALLGQIEALNQKYSVDYPADSVTNQTDSVINPADSVTDPAHWESFPNHSVINLTDSVINPDGSVTNPTDSVINTIAQEINNNIKLIASNNEVIKIKFLALLGNSEESKSTVSQFYLKPRIKIKSYDKIFIAKFTAMLNNKYEYSKKHPSSLILRLANYLRLLYNSNEMTIKELNSNMNVGKDSLGRYFKILSSLGFVKKYKRNRSYYYYLTELGIRELTEIKNSVENEMN
jgi:DNA-binding MarR family transcriptional regulator